MNKNVVRIISAKKETGRYKRDRKRHSQSQTKRDGHTDRKRQTAPRLYLVQAHPKATVTQPQRDKNKQTHRPKKTQTSPRLYLVQAHPKVIVQVTKAVPVVHPRSVKVLSVSHPLPHHDVHPGVGDVTTVDLRNNSSCS